MVLGRVLGRGSKKGLSRRHLEGRNMPFREYNPLRVRPILCIFLKIWGLGTFCLFSGTSKTYGLPNLWSVTRWLSRSRGNHENGEGNSESHKQGG